MYGTDLINVFEVFLPQLLLYPNPTDPLNGEAAALMMRDREHYEQKVKGTSSAYFTRLSLIVCNQGVKFHFCQGYFSSNKLDLFQPYYLDLWRSEDHIPPIGWIIWSRIWLTKVCNAEYCERYAKLEDIGKRPEEDTSDGDEVSEDEEYMSSDEEMAGPADPWGGGGGGVSGVR